MLCTNHNAWQFFQIIGIVRFISRRADLVVVRPATNVNKKGRVAKVWKCKVKRVDGKLAFVR